ncbi:hypothetical protein BT96DRAFT_1017539 [Gymnopus androsaceus JB14]|uniref:GST N-terminal domain-containing protein n=1 Tax=Gymnopus androsaceus JB14 TaxID=1447944 RepID=A0A6A4HXY4_9AGAR|nr:hypothetical protein BT96DRAFT_1017539 [Gymnopus androsaceus JB14]
MLTLYDFDWKLTKGVNWNPHMAKTRELGVKPTAAKLNGDPEYTLPIIIDDSNGVALSESVDIAEYLDKTYLDTSRLLPEGSHALQAAFRDVFYPKVTAWFPFIVPTVAGFVNPATEVFFRDKARRRKEDVWVMGDTPSFADFILAAFIFSSKTIFGPDSTEYKEILEMNDGRSSSKEWRKLRMISKDRHWFKIGGARQKSAANYMVPPSKGQPIVQHTRVKLT